MGAHNFAAMEKETAGCPIQSRTLFAIEWALSIPPRTSRVLRRLLQFCTYTRKTGASREIPQSQQENSLT